MSELAPEMKAYLSVEEQENFCAKISEVIGIARMHVSIRYSAMERWDLQEKIRFKNWFGTIDGIGPSRIKMGLWSMKIILSKLKCSDFLPRTTDIGESLGCVVNEDDEFAGAAVCQIPG